MVLFYHTTKGLPNRSETEGLERRRSGECHYRAQILAPYIANSARFKSIIRYW